MNTQHSEYHRFIRLSLIVLVITLLSAAGFNALIDPYDLFGTTRIKGLNALKPAAGTHIRLSKPYMVGRFSPRTLIGGNSRPELGLDPRDTCWTQADRPVFNIGIPGADIFMQARMLQHAIASGAKKGDKRVFWGLDFMDFLDRRAALKDKRTVWPGSTHDYESRLAVTANGQINPDRPWRKLKDTVLTLFSIDTLKDSLYTLFSQGNVNATTRRVDGFNPARDYVDAIALEGQAVLFIQKNRMLAKTFARTDLSVFGNGRQWSQDFETVSRILEYLKKNGVKATLFINPYHVDYLTLIALSSRWQEFEQWKRQLQHLAKTHDVDLWDFAVLNDFTRESLASAENRTLKWFWEPAHYKSAYGHLMLRQLLDAPCPSREPKPVGALLTPDTMAPHLRHERDAMMRYLKNNPKQLNRLRAYFPGTADGA